MIAVIVICDRSLIRYLVFVCCSSDSLETTVSDQFNVFEHSVFLTAEIMGWVFRERHQLFSASRERERERERPDENGKCARAQIGEEIFTVPRFFSCCSNFVSIPLYLPLFPVNERT